MYMYKVMFLHNDLVIVMYVILLLSSTGHTHGQSDYPS